MDRAFTWPCALWVRQVAASSTGPPTWATRCCYCRCRHRSVCCRWEACRHTYTHTRTYITSCTWMSTAQSYRRNVDTSAELRDKNHGCQSRGLVSGRHLSEDYNWTHCDIRKKKKKPADPLIQEQKQRDSHERLAETSDLNKNDTLDIIVMRQKSDYIKTTE